MKTKVKCFNVFALLFILCIAVSSCGAKVTADISAYGDTPIKIIGLAEEEFTVTPNELAKLECVSISASGKTEKAGSVNSVGPLLDTFVTEYGKKLTDFKTVRFLASDQYQVSFSGDKLTDYTIVMSLASEKDPLPENMRPMRLLIPEADSNNWIYAVIQIEFVPDENSLAFMK
jgi:hypothetical protein